MATGEKRDNGHGKENEAAHKRHSTWIEDTYGPAEEARRDYRKEKEKKRRGGERGGGETDKNKR